MYFEVIKVIAKNERKKTKTWDLDSNNKNIGIGMEFGFRKCAILIMKMESAKGIELLHQERLRTLCEKEIYLCILEANAFR